MLVKEIMTKKVITVRDDETVKEAFKKILDNSITGAPVVNKAGKVIGIISEKDILKSAKKFSQEKIYSITPFSAIQQFKEYANEEMVEILLDARAIEEIGKIKVSDAMTKDVIFVNPEETIENTAKLMDCKKVNRIPVIENEKIVGIITRSDILKAIVKQQECVK